MCGKKKFTKVEVISVLNFNQKKSRNRKFSKKFRKEIRYYHCPNCNSWHLTSKELEETDETEKIEIINEDRWLKLLNNNENDNNLN